jgi:hypothetical protein
MRTVRTTMQPYREIEVDDADYLDLQRQGLLVEDEPAPTPASAVAAPTATLKKTAGSAGSKES